MTVPEELADDNPECRLFLVPSGPESHNVFFCNRHFTWLLTEMSCMYFLELLVQSPPRCPQRLALRDLPQWAASCERVGFLFLGQTHSVGTEALGDLACKAVSGGQGGVRDTSLQLPKQAHTPEGSQA